MNIDLIRLGFHLGGFVDLEVTADRGVLSVSGRAIGRPSVFQALAISAGRIPPSVEELRLSIDFPNRQINLAGPADPLRRWNTSEGEFQKQLAYVEWLASWREDETPILSEAQRRKALAAYVAQVWPVQEYLGCVRPLRYIRDIATRLEDDELAASIRKLLRLARYVAFDEEPSLDERGAAQNLVDWAMAPVEVPPAP